MNLLTVLTTPLHPLVSFALIAVMVFATLIATSRILRGAK